MASAWNVEDELDAPMVSIGPKGVFVDGQLAGSSKLDERATGPLLDLTRMLSTRKETWAQLQPDKPFPGRVVLHVDRDTPVYIVKRAVESATAAGYPDLGFMVMRRFD